MLTRLRYWRNLRAYSVRDLAAKASVNAATITLIENGHREPQGRTVRKLAEALNVAIIDLYSENTDFSQLKVEKVKF